jgi:hypothetical protein
VRNAIDLAMAVFALGLFVTVASGLYEPSAHAVAVIASGGFAAAMIAGLGFGGPVDS